MRRRYGERGLSQEAIPALRDGMQRDMKGADCRAVPCLIAERTTQPRAPRFEHSSDIR